MGFTVPDWADTLLDVVGVGWPNVDEDEYRGMADDLREFADDADEDAHTAHQHVQRLISSGRSEALVTLDEHWSKVAGRHKDLGKAARLIADALDGVAVVVEGRKGLAVAELGELAASVGIALAAIPATGGLSALLGAGKIALTRTALKRIFKEMVEAAVDELVSVMTQPAVAALENIVADLAVQLTMDAAGAGSGVDVAHAVRAGKEGAGDGLRIASAGAGDGLRIASAGGGGGDGPGDLDIDHDAHDHASTHLATVRVSMDGRTRGKLTRAKGKQNRNRGRDADFSPLVDKSVDAATEALEKAAKELAEHIGDALPKGIKKVSDDHKRNDHKTRDRFEKIRPDHDKGDGPGRGGGGGGGSGGDGRGGSHGDGPQPRRMETSEWKDWHGRSADVMRHHRRTPLDVNGLSPEQRHEVLEREAKDLADDAQRKDDDEPGGKPVQRPPGEDRIKTGCSGSLLHDGVITAHTSTTGRHGVTHPETHPAVKEALDRVAAHHLETGIKGGVGHGKCAEVSLISDRLHQIDPDGTSIRTVEDAREVLSGATVHTRQIGNQRGADPLTHGDYKAPCQSCADMLPMLGVRPHR